MCTLRASLVTSNGSGDTRSALTDGSGILIDMWNGIILYKFQRGALFWFVSFSVDSTLSLPFRFYKTKLGYIYTLSRR